MSGSLKMNERKEFIDVAKGIGIILVVLGHLDIDGQISREVIYSFHMPLFFVLSGVFAKTNIRFKEYFAKSFKTLYVPFFVFFIVDLILFYCVKLIGLQKALKFVDPEFLSFTGVKFLVSNAPLWFILALFIIRIVYYFIDKNLIVKYVTTVLCIGFVFAKGYFPDFAKNCIYVVAIPALAFYILGDLLKTQILNFDRTYEKHKKFILIFSTVLFILFVLSAHKNGSIDMKLYRYGNEALYFVNSVVGCFLCLLLSVLMAKVSCFKKILLFYGQNTIVILIAHYYITRKVFPCFMRHFDLADYLYHPITQIIMLTVTMIVMIPVILLANKYFYFLFGKKKPVSKLKSNTEAVIKK